MRWMEAFSASSGASEEFSKANAELDEVKADRQAKIARITELEGLCDERQRNLEQLTEELAKAGALKQSLNFASASSREVNAPASGASSSSGAGPSSSASSAPAEPAICPLMAFVTSRGTGGSRLAPSGTTHSFTGAISGGDGIADALRGA